MELNSVIYALGWTLVNSIWHALIIAILLGIILLFIKPKYSKARSILAFAALLLVFSASIRTYSDLINNYPTKQLSSDQVDQSKYSDFVLFYDVNQFKNPSSNESTSFLSNKLITSTAELAQNNLNIIVTIWLIGIIILSLRMLGGYLYLNKIKTKQIYPVENRWNEILSRISDMLDINQKVEMFESTIIKFPTVIGYFKPVILMPIGIMNSMPISQVEMILAHELAHIKRLDYLLNLLQSFLEIIYFFNPAVWVISKIIRIEREYACDDFALEIIGQDKNIDLINALINIKEIGIHKPTYALSAIGTKNSIFRRINRMLHKENKKSSYTKKFGLSVVLLTSLVVITMLACSTSTESMNQNNLSNADINSNQSLNNNFNSSNNNQITELKNEIEKIEPVQKIDNIKRIENDRKFNFHKDDDHWKGRIEDGKITELYKNGERIPDNKINQYEDFILDTLNEIDEAMADLDVDLSDLKINLENLREDLKNIKVDVDVDEITNSLNSEEFKQSMEELKKSMHEMKFEFNDEWKEDLKEALNNIELHNSDLGHFQSEEFKHEMENLKIELDKLKDIKIDVDFDNDSFKESMRELKENMKDLKVNLKDLDIDMSDLKIDLSNLKVEMKKLKDFMHELKDDLISEGYLDKSDDDFDLILSQSSLNVNGNELPENLHKRYLNMYKKHFGKELEDKFVINH